MLHEYKVTFKDEDADDTITVVFDSHVEPEFLILGNDYSLGEYEFVQECLAALEDVARRTFKSVAMHEFSHVTCPDGTVVEPT